MSIEKRVVEMYTVDHLRCAGIGSSWRGVRGLVTQPPLNGAVVVPKKAAITAASTGGLVTAVLASVCCIGPLVFAALGVGMGATGFLADTAGFLKALMPYRPVFIGLTMLLVGISLYLAYRIPMSTVCGSREVCALGVMSGANRTRLWALAVLAVVLIVAPYWL